MPNGGSDCCGTCWFNRSNGGRRGSANFNRDIPSYCEIRCLAYPGSLLHLLRQPPTPPVKPRPHTHRASTTLVTALVYESSGSRRQTPKRYVNTC